MKEVIVILSANVLGRYLSCSVSPFLLRHDSLASRSCILASELPCVLEQRKTDNSLAEEWWVPNKQFQDGPQMGVSENESKAS